MSLLAAGLQQQHQSGGWDIIYGMVIALYSMGKKYTNINVEKEKYVYYCVLLPPSNFLFLTVRQQWQHHQIKTGGWDITMVWSAHCPFNKWKVANQNKKTIFFLPFVCLPFSFSCYHWGNIDGIVSFTLETEISDMAWMMQNAKVFN